MEAKVTSSELYRRLRPALRNWPEAPRESLEEYLRPALRQSRRRKPQDENDSFGQPYWVLLPTWLDALYSKRRTSRTQDDNLLPDVLRAQYCLFLAFRIRDDLMDDAGTPPRLAGAADRLIGEAGSILARHFRPRSGFWRIYRESICNTAAALKKLDRLQRSPHADVRRMLDQYSRVNSIFRVGAAAVCVSYARMKDYPRIRDFSDKFSAGCQILDDLSDLIEDLDRRRWNFAANYLLRRSPPPLPGERNASQRIAAVLISGGTGVEILRKAAGLLDGAFAAIEPLGIPDAVRCRRAYLDSIGRIRGELLYAGLMRSLTSMAGKDRNRRRVGS